MAQKKKAAPKKLLRNQQKRNKSKKKRIIVLLQRPVLNIINLMIIAKNLPFLGILETIS